MPPTREKKKMLHGLEARAKVLSGVEKLYQAVSSTYGPSGNNVLQGLPYGDPVLTRDGVTVAKRTILEDGAENDAAAIMRQASDKTNKTAGDGTTATVVLGYNLLREAHQLVIAGQNAMVLKAQMSKDSNIVIDFLKSQSRDGNDHLLEVATVSSGDPAIGQLVSETMKDVGVDGGITIREQDYPTLNVEKIYGYYFNKGWAALNAEVKWDSPIIVVAQKRLAAATDMIPLIEYAMRQPNPKLVVVGDVSGEALQVLLQNTVAQVDANGKPFPFEALVINPGIFGEDGRLTFEDIAIYVGAEVISEGMDMKSLPNNVYGTANRVQVSPDQSIIFGVGNADEISSRAAEIKANIDKETHSHTKDQLEQRYSKLLGKIAIVNVGGSTPAEMEELRFRVEDAIEATKSAMAEGVLPGGGTMLVHATQLDISPLFKKALTETFNKLMTNAAESADYRFRQILNAKPGFGFNLRDITEQPVDLTKAGVWDATRAVVQTVENAASSAGALLTVDTIITPLDEEKTK